MFEYNTIITRIIDGDTVEATIDLGFNVFVKKKFRLYNLDTPEIFHPSCDAEKKHGLEAKKFAEELLLNKKVVMTTGKSTGKFGRWLAKITLPCGVDYASKMLKEGMNKRQSYGT